MNLRCDCISCKYEKQKSTEDPCYRCFNDSEYVYDDKEEKTMKNEYIIRDEAMTIPVLPKEQRLQFRNADEAFEEGWRQALECLAFLPAKKVIDLDDALSEVVSIYSPFGKDGSGDAISRTVVLSKLAKLAEKDGGQDDGTA